MICEREGEGGFIRRGVIGETPGDGVRIPLDESRGWICSAGTGGAGERVRSVEDMDVTEGAGERVREMVEFVVEVEGDRTRCFDTGTAVVVDVTGDRLRGVGAGVLGEAVLIEMERTRAIIGAGSG
jgi:hypothetical protein